MINIDNFLVKMEIQDLLYVLETDKYAKQYTVKFLFLHELPKKLELNSNVAIKIRIE